MTAEPPPPAASPPARAAAGLAALALASVVLVGGAVTCGLLVYALSGPAPPGDARDGPESWTATFRAGLAADGAAVAWGLALASTIVAGQAGAGQVPRTRWLWRLPAGAASAVLACLLLGWSW